MKNFKIIADWIDDGPFCQLRMDAGELNLTEHKGDNPEKIIVSALPLAEWLTTSFWRLVHEPGPRNDKAHLNFSWRMAHELQSAAGGYDWPKITFFSQKTIVEVHCNALYQDSLGNGAERYITSGQSFVDIEIFVNEIIRFLSEVADHFPIFRKYHENLKSELENIDISHYRQVEAMLGFDPDQAPNIIMEYLNDKLTLLSWETISELAAGLNPINFAKGCDQLNLLEIQFDKIKGKKGKITAEIQNMTNTLLPWEFGRACAIELRKQENLGSDTPINTKKLLEYTGLLQDEFDMIPTTGEMATCINDDGKIEYKFQAVFSPSARRFQLARVLGAWLANSKRDSIILSSAGTWEQQVQRNFAAELLAPIEGLTHMLDDIGWTASSFRKVAMHYNVSPWTIGHSIISYRPNARANIESILAEV